MYFHGGVRAAYCAGGRATMYLGSGDNGLIGAYLESDFPHTTKCLGFLGTGMRESIYATKDSTSYVGIEAGDYLFLSCDVGLFSSTGEIAIQQPAAVNDETRFAFLTNAKGLQDRLFGEEGYPSPGSQGAHIAIYISQRSFVHMMSSPAKTGDTGIDTFFSVLSVENEELPGGKTAQNHGFNLGGNYINPDNETLPLRSSMSFGQTDLVAEYPWADVFNRNLSSDKIESRIIFTRTQSE